jgi:ribonucleoside-diphosphate reductase alpha chain
MKFADKDGRFEIESFRKAVDVTITAQEIIVGFASYPTKKIEANSFAYRPLGLGYANLGALLMSQGIAYDSDHGRDYAAAITAMMTGEAYLQSAKIAGELGPVRRLRDQSQTIPRRHAHASRFGQANQPEQHSRSEMHDAAWTIWSDAVDLGVLHGYRNSQASVLAPTGTIGFMMDCDTTGIEPDLALVKYKKLVGGGTIKIVNNTVPPRSGSWVTTIPRSRPIVDYINEQGTIEGAPGLNSDHLPVFDCAFKAHESRAIHSVHGPSQNDGSGAAVHLRGDFEDRESAVFGAPLKRSSKRTSKDGVSV